MLSPLHEKLSSRKKTEVNEKIGNVLNSLDTKLQQITSKNKLATEACTRTTEDKTPIAIDENYTNAVDSKGVYLVDEGQSLLMEGLIGLD